MSIEELIKKYEHVPDFASLEVKSIHDKSFYGDQIIHFACVSGDLDDVKELISLGVDVMSIGEDGYTPLHYAVEQGNIEVARYLVSIGADPLYKNGDGESPRDFAEQLKEKIKDLSFLL